MAICLVCLLEQEDDYPFALDTEYFDVMFLINHSEGF